MVLALSLFAVPLNARPVCDYPLSAELLSVSILLLYVLRLVSSDGLVDEERLASVLNFWNGAFEIKGLGQDDLEDLWAHQFRTLRRAES